MRARLLWALLPAVLGAVPAAAAPSSRLDTVVLDSGLTVLVRKVVGAKDAAVAVLFKVGHRDDPEGRSGMASVIAGLWQCAATEKTPARNPVSLLPRWQQGALHPLGWTSRVADDHTLLARTLPAKDVVAEVDDVADRLTGLKVSDDVFQRAVSNLRERLDSLDQGKLPISTAERLARARVVALPHDGLRPGRADQLPELTLAEVTDRLKRYYVVSNAILAITGDVDVGALRAQVKKRLGALPRGESVPKPAPVKAPAPAATEAPHVETVDVPAPGKLSGAALALRAPDPGATLTYAAFLMLVVRLRDAWNAAPPGPAGAYVDVVGAPTDILGDAETLYLIWPVVSGSDAEAIEARLKGALSAAVTKPLAPTDVLRTRASCNVLFGVPPIEGSWSDSPLDVAHADARRAQLELDGEAVMKLVPTVTAKDLAEVAARPSAIVWVRPPH